MQTTETTRRPTPATSDRYDIYETIHKALRVWLCDTLGRLGALDVTDAAELEATLARTHELLDQMAAHLAHEDAFLHPALEAAAPGSSHRIDDEHRAHVATIEALRGEVDRLRATPSDARALRLYRHFALFVAENLQHMQVEETVHNAALWAHHDDAGLRAIEGRLMASIGPDELARILARMLPAITPSQRAGLIHGLRQVAPPAAVEGVLQIAWATLDAGGRSKLAAAVGVAPGA